MGTSATRRTGASRRALYIEASNVNIAGMQDVLYFHDANDDTDGFDPELVVIYTPNLPVAEYPDDRLIAVNLDLNVTRVFNSDYFGESKKGGLRMWNKLVQDRGGLALHAGCKVIPTPSGDRVGLIVGLSGTGKTTTTFTRQNGSLPVQDDFVAWWPDGTVSATEAGCFAKTYALSPEDEPTIYGAVTKPSAYLENVSQNEGGHVDFFDESYTKNGRAVFSFSEIEAADASRLEQAHFLLILNRNENVIPAVARLEGPQAAAFFMLGETTGTAAGGKDEEGKFLRVPGTNPFFPMHHDQQGNRFLELLETNPIEVYIMNTGRVGGTDERSKKVLIPHSSAIVKGIAEGTIEWETDPDFGYQVARSVPGIDESDLDLLQPRRLYEATGRADEYARARGAAEGRAVRVPCTVPEPLGGDRRQRQLAPGAAERRPRGNPRDHPRATVRRAGLPRTADRRGRAGLGAVDERPRDHPLPVRARRPSQAAPDGGGAARMGPDDAGRSPADRLRPAGARGRRVDRRLAAGSRPG